jgi:NIMA (never in mitosis gene a)-related kinase
MEKYEKIRLLGKGTFGKAWLVREMTTGELLVAKEIKVENKQVRRMSFSAGDTQQDVEDALVEAKIMGHVDHVNVVK